MGDRSRCTTTSNTHFFSGCYSFCEVSPSVFQSLLLPSKACRINSGSKLGKGSQVAFRGNGMLHDIRCLNAGSGIISGAQFRC